MDDEEMPWRTPSRNSGGKRPRDAAARDDGSSSANAILLGSDSESSVAAATTAASSGSSASQKRKRQAKKRRRSRAGGDKSDDRLTMKDGDDKTTLKGKEEKAAVVDEPAEWGCPACTFLNGASRRFCEMCGTGNPTKPAAETAPSEWSCVACTMKNAPALRACAVCGTINPNSSMPAVLSIARRSLHSGLFGGVFGGEADDNDDEDGDEDDGSDDGNEDGESDGNSSSDGSSSDGDGDRRLECPCLECGVTIGAGQTSCSECHAPHPFPRRKIKRSNLSSRLHKLARKVAKHDKSKKNKKKAKSSSKNAYGVSSEMLKKLLEEPKSSKLVDTLQALTHTLAMMDASADTEWGDVHGGGVQAFFVHGFGGSGRSDEGKDTALLDVLASIVPEDGGHFSAEVRLFAVQSINYILKMDRHLFKKEDVVNVVRIYLGALCQWTTSAQASSNKAPRDEQMIVEECVNGLCGLCGSEGAMLRELIKGGTLEKFLDFLTLLSKGGGAALHSSVITNSIELLQKCCAKIKWDSSGASFDDNAVAASSTGLEREQTSLAKRVVDLLRVLLKHPDPTLHVYASKCLLLVFRRGFRFDQKHSIVSSLITSDFILELVDVLTNTNMHEPDDSRQAAASLLMHLLDSRREMMETFVREKIYEPLFDGIQKLVLEPGTSDALTAHSLKLVSLLIRRVHRTPTLKSPGKSKASKDSTHSANHQNRVRLDSSPDPDVLAKLLLDFIRADSIPAVSALIKDGADVNFPSIHDSTGQEIEKPLVVAAEVASLGMVRFLIKRGVDVHQIGLGGTALHVAALAGRCDIVSFLLECGASPMDVDREGVTVLKRLDEVEHAEDCVHVNGTSPVRKLLELHQRALRHGEDSDDSEEGANEHRFGSRRWLFAGDNDDEEEFDEDDDPYDIDDDGDEDSDFDSDDDEEMSSDEETGDESVVHGRADLVESPAGKKVKKRRTESVGSERKEAKRSRRNSGSGQQTTVGQEAPQQRRRSSSNATDNGAILATHDQIESFRATVMSCLLRMLREIDHKNVNRSVLSALASALEMAPSAMVRELSDSDISMLLEIVNHLLQDPVMFTHHPEGTGTDTDVSRPPSSAEGEAHSSTKSNPSSAQVAQKAMLASYILALRILQAIVRKSIRESSVFYEIERRGICEQIERLHLHSSHAVQQGSHVNHLPSADRNGIFGRGMQLLEFLRANMVESGMLHLHRLKNLTRRLKELSEASPVEERDMVLTDLVELFQEENSITSHEFKQSNLLEAILSFLMPTGQAHPAHDRIRLLLDHFARTPAAFVSFISRLQSVVNQEEHLPLLSFFTGKGRELYPLTKQLKIVCTRAGQGREDEPKLQKMLQLSALTHFQSFEKTIFRCMPVVDATLTSFYFNLIGRCIHKAVEGKWKKYWVGGFDDTRCTHLLKSVDDAGDDVSEVVLHDTQFKLSTAMDVYADITVDFGIFGEPQSDSSACVSASNSDKKRKRQNKKRQKSPVAENSAMGMAVEVQNAGSIFAGKLRGAWYAGEVVDKAVGEIQPGNVYNVRVLTSGITLKDIPAEKIRLRNDVPQVGSIVEVDGMLGEVTRAESSRENGDHDVFDIKISRDRERKGISERRIRYPPGSNNPSATSSGVIEAMSLSRLFPPRESSVTAGTVGDNVWIAPKQRDGENVPIGDFYIAGVIDSFPAGTDAVGSSATVFVKVSFGSNSSIIKVEQSRVTNLSNGRSRLGSSRLLSALNMVGDRTAGPPFQRLLQSTASNELFSNRPSSGAGSALEHIRQLLSHSSSSRESALSSLLNASSTDTTPATASTSTDETDGKRTKKTDEDASARLARVWKFLGTGEKILFSKCIRPPKFGVVIGYERTENVDVGFDRGGEEEFGLPTSLFGSGRRIPSIPGDASLTEIDPGTGKVVMKAAVTAALTKVFTTFDSNDAESRASSSKSSKKWKKKQKLAMQSGKPSPSSSPKETHVWDIDKFSAFMAVVKGVSSLDDPEGTLVDNCVQFSLFAQPSARRRLLDLQGFLASVANMCKNSRNSRHLLAFLVSRGYNPTSLTGDEPTKRQSKSLIDLTTSSVQAADSVNPADMRTFPSDQNMLKCLHELQGSADPTPPWKLKYFVQCSVTVDWSNVVKRESSSDPVQIEPLHVESRLRTIDGVTSASPMMKAVHLLSCLYEALPTSLKVSADVWRNMRLSNKLETQLEDVLSVCSGVYPGWCDAIVSECKFFFPCELREKLFQATAFGCTRSLHWFRNQLNVDDAAGSTNNAPADSNGPAVAGDGIYNHEITISPIPKERVKVNRENLLSSAEAVMKMHGKRKAILDIVFVGEKGYGSGVTAAFYSATAHALQSIEENRQKDLRCWVPGIENEREDETIRHPNGLFPFPYVGDRPPAKVVERFRMMGRLAGKALMDNRLFPIPLSSQFMKLVLGQRVEMDELERVFLNHGKILKDLRRAVDQVEAGAEPTSIKIDGMALPDWLDAVSFTFIDPISQKALIPNGDATDVTVDNLRAFVDRVLSLWLQDGVVAQVLAFREGISEVLPVEKLNLLFVDELLSLLCGDADIEWDVGSLLSTMKLAHGYTKDSQPVQYFVEVLAEMPVAERREFLLYATGCPNLPAGGFAALRPPFEVVRRVVENDNVDQSLPFARTCTNTLHLPAYSSKRVLDERLRYAIANSAGVIDRD